MICGFWSANAIGDWAFCGDTGLFDSVVIAAALMCVGWDVNKPVVMRSVPRMPTPVQARRPRRLTMTAEGRRERHWASLMMASDSCHGSDGRLVSK